jgi:hypothetical protein
VRDDPSPERGTCAHPPAAPADVVIDTGDGSLPLAPGESRRVTDEKLFRYLLDLEVVKAQRLQYCVSVICLGPDLSATEASRLSMPHVLSAILRRTRATDVVTQLADGPLAALLVDAETAALPAIIGRLRDELTAVTGVVPPSTTWSAGAACYPKTAPSPAEVLRLAVDLATRARRDGGDRYYIAS